MHLYLFDLAFSSSARKLGMFYCIVMRRQQNAAVCSVLDYLQMDVYLYVRKKVSNTSKFWDKDVSKRSEFSELRPNLIRTLDETLGDNNIAGKLAQSGEQWQFLGKR